MTSPEHVDPNELPMSFGRFELVRLLGEGNMGRVFEARLQAPGGFRKTVAVKVLKGAGGIEGEDYRAALRKEARIGALLAHPNIIETYDFGEDDSVPWISMRLVDGDDLDDVLRAMTRLDGPEVLEIGVQLLSGLHSAHHFEVEGEPACVIHRDIKPSNVSLGTDGVVRLMDFGIAKAAIVSGIMTATGLTKGTASYMSPEQARGKTLDGRSDLFAVAALLYSLAMGRALFRGNSLIELLTRIVSADRTLAAPGLWSPLEERSPGLPAVLRAALRVNPDERPPTAAAFKAQLEALQTAAGGPRASLVDLSARVRGGVDATADTLEAAGTPDVANYTYSPPPIQTES